MNIEKIATLKVEPILVKYGVDCMVCGNMIPMALYPKICEECRRGLMQVLYPNRRDNP